jgi:hypothetical protein
MKWICKRNTLKMNCNTEILNRSGPSSNKLDIGMGESYFIRCLDVRIWGKRSVTEASIATQQLLKTHFRDNEYAHNIREAVRCSVFPSVHNEPT